MIKTAFTLILLSFSCQFITAKVQQDKVKKFQIEHISPITLTRTTDGTYLADFGKDAFGTLELHYKTDGAETLTICLGEKLLNGKIDANPGGTIRYVEVKVEVNPNQERYTVLLPADKRNTSGAAVLLPDSFGVVMPFRYSEIKNATRKITGPDLFQKAFFHAFDESQSDFSSSDTILNQVWNLCKYSIKATSFAGLYIDGDRERIAYEADAYINQLGHYCTDCDYRMAQQTIEHFMEHPTWPTEWLLHTALMVYQDYYYTGNAALLEKYYKQLKYKTLSELIREDGLISTTDGRVTADFMRKIGFSDPKARLKDIVDWPPGQKDTGWKLVNPAGERDGYEMLPINTVVNCFFYENMKIMAEMAGVLHQEGDREYYEIMAVKVKEAINQKLFDAGKGVYLDGEGSVHSSLHANMMALAFGLVPAAHKKTVTDFIRSRGMACSVYGSQYLLEGLYQAEEGQYALDLLRATGDRSWWNMIRVGSTITMEAWDMKYKPNSDWNHAWGAAPANIIPRGLWGIRPKTPGFGVVSIRPQMGDLQSSTIRTPTIHGQIICEYKKTNDRQKAFSIRIPKGMTCEFYMDLKDQEILYLNGKKTDTSLKFVTLLPGTNGIRVYSEGQHQ